MTPETKALISEVAERIAANTELEIEELIEVLGGRIVETNNAVQTFCVPKTGDSLFTAYVCKHLPSSRRNFFLAKVLGHLVLHLGFEFDPDTWAKVPAGVTLRFNKHGWDEESDEFARTLLMPREAYLEKLVGLRDGSPVDVERIATSFGVPRPEVGLRGLALRCLHIDTERRCWRYHVDTK